MSDTPETTTPIDLSDLRMTPKWVADFGNSQPQFHTHEGESQDRPRRDRDGRGGGGERSGFGGGRGGPPRPGGGRPPGGGDRGQRTDGRREGGPPRAGQRDDRRDDRRDRGEFGRDRDQGPRFENPPVVQGLVVLIEPDIKAVEAMASMIRSAGKAYSVFDAAKLVLSSGDRFDVTFTIDAPNAPKFATVPADGSVWLTWEDALAHLMQSDVLSQYYRAEEIELEEPKGIFTSIAICGFSGELLGPPNHHSYQAALHRIHREGFAHIHFEDFKRRVRTDSSPEAVEKWKEAQRHGRQWIDIKAEVPEGGEATRFKSRAEMETHFKTVYADSLLGETARATVPGNIPKKNLPPTLYFALRRSVDEARKHLLAIAQQLCAGFEKQGLKLFKRRGGKLWVSRTRPKLLDSTVVLSDRITKMIELVKTKPGIHVKDLVEGIAPGEEAVPVPSIEVAVEEAAPVAEAKPSPLAQERIQVLKDLYWLNSEGYLVEYSDSAVFIGVMEPPPAKPKAIKLVAAEPAADAAQVEEKTEEAAPEPTAIDAETSETPMKEVVGTDDDFIIDPVEETSEAKITSAGDAA